MCRERGTSARARARDKRPGRRSIRPQVRSVGAQAGQSAIQCWRRGAGVAGGRGGCLALHDRSGGGQSRRQQPRVALGLCHRGQGGRPDVQRGEPLARWPGPLRERHPQDPRSFHFCGGDGPHRALSGLAGRSGDRGAARSATPAARSRRCGNRRPPLRVDHDGAGSLPCRMRGARPGDSSPSSFP